VGTLFELFAPLRHASTAPVEASRSASTRPASSPELHASPPPPTKAASDERPPTPNALALAHARFARAALAIYVAAAAVSVALLMIALLTDKAHDEQQIKDQIVLQTDARAHALSQRLGLLGDEVRRLSQRSEVDLRDSDLSPEESLLQLSHEQSALFNVGVAILDRKGEVVRSVPHAFLAAGSHFAHESWFGGIQEHPEFRIVPVAPDRPDSLLYMVAPLIKGGDFTGAILGAVDLAQGQHFAPDTPTLKLLTVVATASGDVVYPPVPPAFASEPPWRRLFATRTKEPFAHRLALEGAPAIVAASPVSGSELVLLSVGSQDELFQAERARLRFRLLAGLSLALTPALLLLWLFQRSLKLFRKSEEAAVREERLRLLGEAANSIAHEVKNALNGLSMGLDLVVRATADANEAPGSLLPSSRPMFPVTNAGPASRPSTAPGSLRAPINRERRERVVNELRREIQRLSEFTTELMTFSRGVEPRRAKLDLVDFVPKVTGLLLDSAEELGGEIEVRAPTAPIWVQADAALLHAVVSNLAGNALDAATAESPTPRVEVRLGINGDQAELRVSDNGPGVSASMKSRLFEPFQSGKANGVGIGLALSRKIARAHGGDLILDELSATRPGFPGASFVLLLPLLHEVNEP
jgi:two-component system C4-dicarboxylate transport sensor histidine kinase DctB